MFIIGYVLKIKLRIVWRCVMVVRRMWRFLMEVTGGKDIFVTE